MTVPYLAADTDNSHGNPAGCPLCQAEYSHRHLGSMDDISETINRGGGAYRFAKSWCELCGKRFDLLIFTHKGSTYIEGVEE